MRFRAFFSSGLFLLCSALPANAVVGTDFYKAQPDPFCAAHISSVAPVHQRDLAPGETDLGTDTEFAIVLAADTPKSVSGTIQLLSGDRPYLLKFPEMLLEPHAYSVREGERIVQSGTLYQSNPIYVTMPAPMPLRAAWVYDLAVNGAAVNCGTLPVFFSKDPSNLKLRWEIAGPAKSDVRGSAPAQGLVPVAEKRLDLSGCPQLIKEAQMIESYTPAYPPGTALKNGMSEIRIALDAAGHVADASVLIGSGTKDFDQNGLYSAIHSKYNPRIFLCSSIPGFYTFRARFRIR